MHRMAIIPTVPCSFCGLKLIVPTNVSADFTLQRHILCDCDQLDRFGGLAYKDRLTNLFTLSLKMEAAIARVSLLPTPAADHGLVAPPKPDSPSLPALTCEICNKVFKFRSQKEVHTRSVHLKLKPFSCTICDQRFSHNFHLQRHQQAVHNKEKPFICIECGNNFSQSSSLKQHQRAVHMKLKPFHCAVCDRCFSRLQHLKSHQRTVHKKKKKAEEEEEKKPSHCTVHKTIHKKEKPFHCVECAKHFNQAYHLQIHQRAVHSGEKPLQCDVCGILFSQFLSLKFHKVTVHHTGEYPFICEWCNRGFFTLGMKTEHQETKQCYLAW